MSGQRQILVPVSEADIGISIGVNLNAGNQRMGHFTVQSRLPLKGLKASQKCILLRQLPLLCRVGFQWLRHHRTIVSAAFVQSFAPSLQL